MDDDWSKNSKHSIMLSLRNNVYKKHVEIYREINTKEQRSS